MRVSPTIGLALSGSGNRSTFYIGFLERLSEAGINPTHLTACSGGSIVAAVYATGNLKEFKEYFLSLTRKDLVRLLTSKKGQGGLFSLEPAEEAWRRFTKSLRFENSPVRMAFVAVDLNSGELVDLCMGDLAHAARISCTVPGFFEPEVWGSHILVDGGLLCIVPMASLKKFNPDITIGIDMRATPHIFTSTQIEIKRFVNWVKKAFFIEEFKGLFINGGGMPKQHKGLFSVIGRSLDVIIEAEKRGFKEDRDCDLMIIPEFPRLGRSNISEDAMKYYYLKGIETAEKYLPKIQELVRIKSEEKVYAKY